MPRTSGIKELGQCRPRMGVYDLGRQRGLGQSSGVDHDTAGFRRRIASAAGGRRSDCTRLSPGAAGS